MAIYNWSAAAPQGSVHQVLPRRCVQAICAGFLAWIDFYLIGIIIASVRMITYKNIAQLHGGLLAAYLLSIAPADMLLRSIMASLLFHFTIKFIGERVGSVFVLRKPLKLKENFALVVIATVSIVVVAVDIFY
ncbi:hypothetical protein BKA64DRAFT_641974 [Cadophora sp. MPI-SDFR-AT-0126]|nr:hypothetical protein BKA64DRAFT_641974 [Leotiomycetes sp. MPI-SDFR-AT-0126]